MILADVDGVFTDGGIVFDNQGIESKRFHIRDGFGVKVWIRAGYRFGLVTGRNSQIVLSRAGELGIDTIRQGIDDKLPVVQSIAKENGLSAKEICYVGDDLPDIPAILWAGLGIAVADSPAEVHAAADHVTTRIGGGGAVREIIETILEAQDRWTELVQRYMGNP